MGVGIHNAGGKPLDVSAITLVNGLAGFVLEDTTDALGNDIDPGDTVEFFVRFDPSRVGDAADVIEIVSNAPDQSIVRVPLTGIGAQFAPMAMVNVTDGGNFGGVSLGTNRTVTSLAAITNAGRQPLNPWRNSLRRGRGRSVPAAQHSAGSRHQSDFTGARREFCLWRAVRSQPPRLGPSHGRDYHQRCPRTRYSRSL